jgi:dihydropteroate synthase
MSALQSQSPPGTATSWHVRGRTFEVSRRALVMGVLNVTPDSFSDGGRFVDPDAALRRALAMVEEGADLIDIGGESTRPGSAPVADDEEIARVRPVIELLRPRTEAAISIDTRKTEVARVALDLGADVVNDISGLRGDTPSPRAELAARAGAGLVLMHMQGEPATMQKAPRYDDVVSEVKGFLFDAARRAEEAGMPHDAIAIDPGIGFGKSAEHSVALLRAMSDLAATGYPVLIGISRKSMFEKLLGLALDERLEAGLAAAVASVLRGARIVRTHDVRATVRALRFTEHIL